MRKILFVFLLFTAFFSQKAAAQLNITFSKVEVEQGNPATVDVTVSGFTDVLAAQFSIDFDSLILSYASVTNINLVNLFNSNFNGPGGLIKNGKIIFSWNSDNGMGLTIPNGTRIFSLVFNTIGPKNSVSEINLSNVPRIIQVANGSLGSITVTTIKGEVRIKGDGGGDPIDPCPNPVCANPSNLTISGLTTDIVKGDSIWVPIRVRNFNSIQYGQGGFKWNSSILRFRRLRFPTTGALAGFSGSVNSSNAANGDIRYVWFNNNAGTPASLPDNSILVEILLEAIGQVGQTGCVVTNDGPIELSWGNDSGEINICHSFARLKIVNTATKVVGLTANNATGAKGTTICMDVTVRDFSNIFGIRTSFTWNPAQLRFVRTDNYNLDNLNMSAFSTPTQGSLAFLWTNANAVTRADNARIFQVCFELIGDCDAVVPVMMLNPSDITGQVGGAPANVPSTVTNGNITITCTPPPTVTCTTGTISNVDCNGGNNGSIIMAVTGAGADCACQWLNATGGVVKPSGPVSAGCNLTGVGAGTYTFQVICSGVIGCTKTETINQPNAITLPSTGVVTNVGCGTKGSINISTTTGGTQPYTFVWTPVLGNVSNPTNLDAGTYTVVVTDSKLCTATASFVVGASVTPLIVSATPTAVRCRSGASGSILLNVSGGCPTYSYAWSGGLSSPNPVNVRAGTYTCTVTDSSTPANTNTVTVTVNEPASALSIGTPVITNTTGGISNGSISITITGGTPNYQTSWTGPTNVPAGNTSGTIVAGNLSAGLYNVVVTDTNGCTASLNGIDVRPGTPVQTAPVFGTNVVTSNFNGASVPCFGDRRGAIRVEFASGSLPIMVTLRLGNNVIANREITTLTAVFEDLGAGSYVIEGRNVTGTITSNLVITEPRRLAATINRTCTQANADNGKIELLMNGTGTAPYTFEWLGLAETDSLVENLAKDAYNVTITDANLCQVRLTNIQVEDCPLPGECFEASTIITPNGDNFNELFVIKCVADNASDLTVYDRWGRVVYTKINYDNTWNGEDDKGVKLIEGGYIWVLTVNFGQGRREVYKGTVTLLRSN